MKIAVVSNWKDRLGLYAEGKILCDILQGFGHTCDALQYDQPLPTPDYRADLLIALETHCPHLMAAAPVRWIVVNVEWFTPDLIPEVGANYQKVVCKTREAFELLKQYFPSEVVFAGFAVRDIYDPTVPRKNVFLHIGGNSSHRNTEAVVDAWRWKQNGEGLKTPLFVVSRAYKPSVENPLPERVYLLSEFIPDEELRRLQNECFFHLYPSSAEGFGHALREGLICGNMVLGTDKPPLNEIDMQYRVRATRSRRVGLTYAHSVDAREINLACRQMPHDTVYENFRESILEANAGFAKRIGELLEDVSKPMAPTPIKTRDKNAPKRVAFLGNFKPFFSTENEIKWTLEREGTIVYPLQENEVKDIGDMIVATRCDLFLWVRTPGYLQIPDLGMETFLETLRSLGVPSASYHLDRFWDIPEREALIAGIPFWQTKFVFTADGGNQDKFKQRGVNHHWIRPAVCLRGCYPGNVRPEYQAEVAFVGSVDYHREYPERRQLIDAARLYFGETFKVITGVRGQDLNDVYASAKVVLGDSMFAHQANGKSDYYYSDRVFETMGRGGVLVHPAVKGLSEKDLAYGLCLTPPGNYGAAFEQIDFLLERNQLRRDMRNAAMDVVRREHTYTNRMNEMWQVIDAKA